MSLPHETVLELMGLADGQLEGEAKARAEQLVAESDEARQIVESMRGSPVGAWLRETTNLHSAARLSGIADKVMAGVGATRSEEGGVVRLARPHRRRSMRARIVFAAAGVALGLAAGVALYARSGGGRMDDLAPVASVSIPAVDFLAPSASVAEQGVRTPPAHGVEVNEIDAPRDMSVFEIPLSAAAGQANPSQSSSVVIWVEDDPGLK